MSEPAERDDGRRRPRWGRRIGAMAVLLALVSPWWAPPFLRRMDFFRVHHVEVRGARFTPPREILTRLKVDTTVSIWDDHDAALARVREHPQVADARLSRRFPGTLVVIVREHEPVAFVQSANGLRAYDGAGRALPLDPSRTPVDLPVVPRADTALLRFLAEIRTADAVFFRRISEARRSGQEVILQLMDVLVRAPSDMPMDRIPQVLSVEDDLARRRLRATELDLRFKDQVIARLP